MKNLYPLALLLFSFFSSMAQTSTCITIAGSRTNGKFQQLWLDNRAAYHCDTSQPEMGTAAWTCYEQGSPDCNFRSLFRFDVRQVPANAVITSAKLYLYAKANAINGDHVNPMYGSSNTSLLQRVTSYWTVGGTGWANQPSATTTSQKVLSQSTSPLQNYNLDVTDFVQYWVNKPDSNYGMLMRLQAENAYNSMIFHSGQGPDSLKPRLEICYTVPPPPPTCNNALVIRGDRISGKYKQLWLSTMGGYTADSSQPEMGAAAWTCNEIGYPTCNFRSLFRYDVSNLPAGAVITSAKLYLYAKTNAINGNYGNPTFGTTNTGLIQRVINNWNLGGTGWTNQPAATTASQKVLPQSTNTKQNYTVDVTDFVQYWVNKPDSNYGMLLRLQTEEYYNSLIFHSGQGPDSLKPKLEICYTLTKPDSCKADFIDSTYANAANRLFIALPTHNNNKKPVKICWIFGDGKDTCINYDSSANYYAVSHNYATAGSYSVCVKITYQGGCVAEKCKTINVTAPPVNPICNNVRVIRASTTGGVFKQLWISTMDGYAADTSQPELGAAAWTCNAIGYPTCTFRSVFRYDVSSLPANAVITNAKLYLYAKTNNINGYYGNPTYGSNNTALLQRVTTGWSMAGTGWTNQPPATTGSQKILPQSSSNTQNYMVDVTDFVQYWVNKPDSNYGMLLRLQTEEYYNSLIFHSGQGPESLRPRLEICYTIPNTGADSCRANFSDSISDNNPLKKRFIASVWNSANKKPVQICWNFGDGKDTCINYTSANTPVDYQVTHLYAAPGNYNICVKVKYDGGCVADKCRQITVFGAPVTNCAGSTTLIVKGSATNGKFKQLWLDSKNTFSSDASQPEMGAAAWTCNAQGYPVCNFRSVFRYDLQGIPANARITNARLYLYAKTNNINGNYGNPTYGSNNTTLLQQVITPWSMNGTGWNNQPAITTERQKQLPQSASTRQNYVVDVSDFVQDWVRHPEKNYGMLLGMQTEEYYNSMIFHSGQAPDSLQPRLEVCYTAENTDTSLVEVKLYSNPTTGPLMAYIYTSNGRTGSASLYDMQGNLKQVLKPSIVFYPGNNAVSLQINRVRVPAGNYFVKIWVGDTMKSFKILVL